MQSFSKLLGGAILSIALAGSLSACQPKVEPIKADAQQIASLERLRKNCIAASQGKEGRMYNLAVLRSKKEIFSCNEMKLLCENDYASEMCKGMMTVASVEHAVQRSCRSSKRASGSSACSKVTRACNGKGFTSPECASEIARYNR